LTAIPSPTPPHAHSNPHTPTNNRFRIIYCFSSFLQKQCVRSDFGSLSSSTKFQNASEDYLSCRTFLMLVSIAGSNYFVVCWGDHAKLCICEGGTKTEKSRDAYNYTSHVFSLRTLI